MLIDRLRRPAQHFGDVPGEVAPQLELLQDGDDFEALALGGGCDEEAEPFGLYGFLVDCCGAAGLPGAVCCF